MLGVAALGCGRDAPREPSLPASAASASAGGRPLGAPPSPPGTAPPSAAATAPPSDHGPPPRIVGGGERSVSGRHGVVTSVEEHATRAGVSVLEAGGNAVDAAVAVAAALAVTHPSAGNLGGGGFLLARPRGGPTTAIDFRETAPSGVDPRRFSAMIAAGGRGPSSVGVPGTVAGLALAHERLGRLPWAHLIEPAVRLARDGHRVGDRQARTIRWAWRHLDAGARAVFGRGGAPLARGARLRQPELARTLERVASRGRAGFYEGETAAAIIARLGRERIAPEDLAGYRAVVREPLRVRYRGLDVELMPPPSGGGAVVALTLAALGELRAWERAPGSAEEVHLVVEVWRRAHAERRRRVGDPEALGAEADAELRRRWAAPRLLLDAPPRLDPRRATPSREIDPEMYAAATAEQEHTTHFSIVDADGMVVSCTTTLSAGFGAGVSAAGVVLNDSVAAFGTAGVNLPAPGRRSVSSMSPALVLRDGAVLLVLGSPGGETIPSTVTQVLRHLVDHGLPLDDAIDAPRLHHSFVPDHVRIERGRPIPAELTRGLEALGHRVAGGLPMGDANDALVLDGVAWAYADPREGGRALAARPAAPPRAPADPATPPAPAR
ncbi:MAG: gamma-glutamyltransferase [Polyangiaceae bacterium]|nr:gamma-glutamyltransferase [Polyangiaceae bacterium]